MSTHTFPVPASDAASTLAAIREQHDKLREATLAALCRLGEATTKEIADALGERSSAARNVVRSRLVGYERQGYVGKRFDPSRPPRGITVWRALPAAEGSVGA